MGLFNKKKNDTSNQVKTEENVVNETPNDTMFDDMELDENTQSVVLAKTEYEESTDDNDNDSIDIENDATTEIQLKEKKSKKKLLGGKQEEKEYILYIITDRKNPYMLEYIRQLGVDVTRIFTNISEAKDTLLMQVNPAKIVIIDTGTGRFSTIGQRREIIDLMGIADDEAMISVYQTDSVIRSEIKYNDAFDSKDIHWHKYKSTADVVAHLLNNKGREKYIFDTDDKEEIQETADDVLNFKGLAFTEPNHLDVNMGSAALKLSDILNNMTFNEDKTHELESYVPRY